MMAYIKPKLVTELSCAVIFCVTVLCERNVRLTYRHRASYIYRTTAPLTSRCSILYIYSTNMNTKFI
jgi:hypothetical protein